MARPYDAVDRNRPSLGSTSVLNEGRPYGFAVVRDAGCCRVSDKCPARLSTQLRDETLLGAKEYAKRFGKSEVHACGSHAKCGASSQILNWVNTSSGECRAQGGLLIEEVNGKKVAKKA